MLDTIGEHKGVSPRLTSASFVVLMSAQCLLALLGLGLSFLKFDEEHLCVQHPAICVPLSRIELWLTRSAAFWTLGATLCVMMAKGNRQDQWLSTGLDLQLLLAPVCGVDSLLHGWKATSAYLSASSCGGRSGISGVQVVMGSTATAVQAAHGGSAVAHGAAAEPPPCIADVQTVLAHAAACLMMVIMTVLCVRAAVTLRAQQQELEASADPSNGKGGRRHNGKNKLPRGWRCYDSDDGSVIYEHRRSGLIQREHPGCVTREGASYSEAEEGRHHNVSDREYYSDRGSRSDRGTRSYSPSSYMTT